MPIRNIFTAPPRTPLVGASILAADFARLGDESRQALQAGADFLHLDVMDGHFVPNLSMGPAMCRGLRNCLPEAFLDVHLMVTEPRRFVEPFAEAGADHITFHVEAESKPIDLCAMIRNLGISTGVAVNPPTDIAGLLPLLRTVDLVLLMTVNPGFAGQSFIAAAVERAAPVRRALRADQRLAVDGGVNAQTASSCARAGCDVLVAASAIFGSGDYAAAIAALRGQPRLASGKR